MTYPVPIVSMEEAVAQLSERGQLEWELAVTKAQLMKALTADDAPAAPPVAEQWAPTVPPVAESGHFPEPSAVPPPEHSGEITLDNGGATPV